MRPPSRRYSGPSPRQRMFRKVWTAQPYSAATSVSVSRFPAASLAAGSAGVSGCIVHPLALRTCRAGTLGMVRLNWSLRKPICRYGVRHTGVACGLPAQCSSGFNRDAFQPIADGTVLYWHYFAGDCFSGGILACVVAMFVCVDSLLFHGPVFSVTCGGSFFRKVFL